MNDLMIDLETLGTTPDAAIVSVGAVWFDPRSDELGEELYRVVNLSAQSRRIDPNTVLWWMGQPPAARAVFQQREQDKRLLLSTVLGDLSEFIGPAQPRVWSQGASFDVVLLEDAYRQFEMQPPWKFWNIRDTRTVYDLASNDDRGATAHHALADAIAQAKRVQRCYAKLGLSRVAVAK